MDRIFYKLLVLGLALVAVASALTMASQIEAIFSLLRQGTPLDALTVARSLLYPIGYFLVSLVWLYWAPKVIKKFFPEVS